MVFTRQWIEEYPKTINENGCWIPNGILPTPRGYVRPLVNGVRYNLHRVSMAVYHNVNYYDPNIVSRHAKDCDKACFNPNHLTPGSQGDNNRDAVIHKTNHNASKKVCPKCGSDYHYVKSSKKYINGKVRITRRCRKCYNENKQRWRKSRSGTS